MFKDNITQIKFDSVPLDIVRKIRNAWLLTKTSGSEKIPMTLWHQIVTLIKKHTEAARIGSPINAVSSAFFIVGKLTTPLVYTAVNCLLCYSSSRH